MYFALGEYLRLDQLWFYVLVGHFCEWLPHHSMAMADPSQLWCVGVGVDLGGLEGCRGIAEAEMNNAPSETPL